MSCAVRTATLEVLRRELLTVDQLLTCVTDEVCSARVQVSPPSDSLCPSVPLSMRPELPSARPSPCSA